jgi:enamine deaminase RidA (YjgF/YER057c/UK114 family)
MQRQQVPVASPLGAAIGYSRAVRAGALVFVSGTTATAPEGGALHPGDAGKQTEVILERIAAALHQLGSRLDDVVETRIYVTDMALWQAVGKAHGAVFKDTRPASTLVEVSALIYPELLVEISAIAADA